MADQGLIVSKNKILSFLETAHRANMSFKAGFIARACNLSMRYTLISLRELVKEGLVIKDASYFYRFNPKSPEFTGNIEFSIEI